MPDRHGYAPPQVFAEQMPQVPAGAAPGSGSHVDVDAAIARGLDAIRADPDLVTALVHASSATTMSPYEFIRVVAGAAIVYGTGPVAGVNELVDAALNDLRVTILAACREAGLSKTQLAVFSAALRRAGQERPADAYHAATDGLGG